MPLLMPVGFFARLAAPAVPSLTYGGVATLTGNTSGTGNAWAPASVWTPASADVALFVIWRPAGAGTTNLVLTPSSGSGVVRQSSAQQIGAGKAGLAVFTVRGVTTGAPFTPSLQGDFNWGRPVLYGVDLLNWTGSYHEVDIDAYTGVAISTVTRSGTLSSASSLTVGFVGMIAAGATWTEGSYTEDAEATEGTTDGTASCAALYHRTGGAAGATQTFVPVASKSWTDWGSVLGEFW